jgi:single-strand DNA-binding protein
MPELNSLIIAGRLTRDPELKYTGAGRAYCKVAIANSRRFKTKEGEQREETVFLEGTLWDQQAEYVAKNLAKGRPVLIEGGLRQEEWQDKESGQKRSRICMQINRLTPLDWADKKDGDGPGSAPRQAAPAREAAREPGRQRDIEERMPEDDIPF